MKNRLYMLVVIVVFGFGATACSKPEEHTDSKPTGTHQRDAHAAPHGGELVELAGGTLHVEFVSDESVGALVVYVLDGALKPLLMTEKPILNVVTAGGPKQISGVAVSSGTAGASQWDFRDEVLRQHLEAATLRVTIAGKTYNPELPHSHD